MVPSIYRWSVRDRLLYGLSLVPFLTAFIGTAWLLALYNPWMTGLLLFFYLLLNLFQAGCCVGCPYRGKYCPAFLGIYPANVLSGILYPRRKFDQGFFDRSAAAGEFTLLVMILFPIYWMLKTAWFLLPIYLLLLAAHLVIFMPTQCEKCSYHETCPGGLAWIACRAWLSSRRK
jgi:hypothetical protein